MNIVHPTINNYLYNQNGRISRLYQYNIVSWDMDTNMSVLIPHGLGLDFLNIFGISVVVRSDDGSRMFVVDSYGKGYADTHPFESDIHIHKIDVNSITIYRRTGSNFDDISYSDPNVIRGQLSIWLNT